MATKLPNENLPKQPLTGSSNPTSSTNVTGVKLEIKTEPGIDGIKTEIKSEPMDVGSIPGSSSHLDIKTEIKSEIKQEPDVKPSTNSNRYY